MKPLLFYTIVTLLFLLIPLSGLAYLKNGLLEKYEIEHTKLLEMDIHQFKNGAVQEQINTINALEQSIQQQQLLLIGLAAIGLISGISLLKYKKHILKR
jgi:hypothetical protein